MKRANPIDTDSISRNGNLPTAPPVDGSSSKKLRLEPAGKHSSSEGEVELGELFSENVIAKIWAVASRALSYDEPPTLYPEYTEPGGTAYCHTSMDFWTSGFFPGILYLLLERLCKYPHKFHPDTHLQNRSMTLHPLKLRHACAWWSENMHSQATRSDTHDIGFMIQPWAQPSWELERSERAFQSMITAAKSLASRYDEKVGSLRSWDVCITKRYKFVDPTKDFLVIIDNMINLDLLYYVSAQTRDPKFAQIATQHALTTMRTLIRPDNSTFHVVNFDQSSGKIKARMTNQGYSDDSCWSRGQAWGILGFAKAYHWTRRREFRDAADRLAEYFMNHLPADGVPPWDFSAPDASKPTVLRDTSAAMIAVYGMLLLHQAHGLQSSHLKSAFRILNAVLKSSLAPKVHFAPVTRDDEDGDVNENGGSVPLKSVVAPTHDPNGAAEETILRHATINNYEHAPRRWADHGLVYADYYFVKVGNLLCEMGLA